MTTPETLYGPQGPLLMLQSPRGDRFALQVDNDGAIGMQHYFNPSEGGLIGAQMPLRNPQRVTEGDSEQEASGTESTTYTSKLALQFEAPFEADYEVKWYFESTMMSNNRYCHVRILLDGITVLGEDEYRPREIGLWKSSCGWGIPHLTKGNHTIVIQYRSQNKEGEAKIRNARIHVSKV